MAREEKGDLVVGLDIGTTKVCCVIAEQLAADVLDVIGVGTAPSRGMKKGVVVDLEATIDSITKAIVEAERMAGVRVTSVFVGVTGEHVKGTNGKGVIAVSGGDKEIREQDKLRVIEAARTIAFPSDRQVIHVIPQEFIVDEQSGIKDPIGMSGVRLEADVHIITASQSALQNIVKSVNRAGFGVDGIVLQPLAAAEAVLTQDEKDLGVVLADIGGGTTDLAMFSEGSLWHTGVIAVGGIQVTNDVAIGLRTSNQEAEDVKKKSGASLTSLTKDGQEITVKALSGKSKDYSRRFLAEIIEPRMEEVFELIDREIKKNGFETRVGAGVVLTGGACQIEGACDLAEKVLNMPVRLGVPRNIGGLTDSVSSPFYATSVGLALYGLKHGAVTAGGGHEERGGGLSSFYGKVKKWLGEYF